MSVIAWFRRDLRLQDNTALFHASRDAGGHVLPVFIFDDAILGHPDVGPPVVDFMIGCLSALRDQIRAAGSEILFLHGRPLEQLQALVKLTGAEGVYFNKDYAPAAVERDEEVERVLGAQGVRVASFKDQVVFEEQEILAVSTGRPYTVYTPYRKAWLARLAGDEGAARVYPIPKLQKPPPVAAGRKQGLNPIDLPTPRKLGFAVVHASEIPPGEPAGRKMLEAFCQGPLANYDQTRNDPSLPSGSSRLSPHLRHGTISPRTCIQALTEAKAAGGSAVVRGADVWLGELVWREFFQQVLFNFPKVETGPFRREPVVRAGYAEGGWERWCEGKTGVPIVDAGMRQLNSTGWMHNRLRMIAAMFLCKDLLLDYRLGERYFMQRLMCGETAQNNGNWQWVAGTGTDAQPFFRIFNPVTQAQRFDAAGTFVRRFCPELARVPDEHIHQPHLMTDSQQRKAGCRIGDDYPAPVVDHSRSRAELLRLLKSRRV